MNELKGELTGLEIVVLLESCVSGEDFFIKNLSDEKRAQIIDNLKSLINLKSSCLKDDRDLVSKFLKTLSSKDLAKKFPDLLEAVNSDFFLVREEAKNLLCKIDAEDLPRELEALKIVTSDTAITDVLTAKIVSRWNLFEKVSNFKFILELQSSNNKELARLGDSSVLDVLKFCQIEILSASLSFLVKCSESIDIEIREKAIQLSLNVLCLASVETRLSYLKYMIDISLYDGDDLMRSEFRSLALKTISENPNPRTYPEFTAFFLNSLEYNNKRYFDAGLDFNNRECIEISLDCLYAINPDELPLEVLVHSQRCNSRAVCSVSTKLSKKISEKKLLEHLDFLLDAHLDIYLRFLSSILIDRILEQKLLTKEELIQRYRSRNILDY